MKEESKEGFDFIVELEELDHLMRQSGFRQAITVLEFVSDHLNRLESKEKRFRFEVIEFGFQGYYPVIGIQLLKNGTFDVEEYVRQEFEKVLSNTSLKTILDYSRENDGRIESLTLKFKST